MGSGLRRRTVIVFAVMGIVLPVASAMAKSRTLTGAVTYRERMALPPSAIVEVRLVDVSLADAPSKTIARTSVRPRRQGPVPYRLRFDDRRIEARGTYALLAEIRVDGRLWFTTTTRHPVPGGGADRADILVERVAAPPDAVGAGHPEGRWLAEDIRQGGVIDRLQTVLEIAADGRVSGTGGCNRISGKATISGDRIAFGPVASTFMACTPAVMN